MDDTKDTSTTSQSQPAAPVWFKPKDAAQTLETSGIKMYSDPAAAPDGHYWCTPDGILLDAGSHEPFADQWLGGVSQAYSIGMVRMRSEGDTVVMQVGRAADLANPMVDPMARTKLVTFVEAGDYGWHTVSAVTEKLIASNRTLLQYAEPLMREKKEESDRDFNRSPLSRFLSLNVFADKTQVIAEPLTVDHLSITFHDKLFDYYLSAPNMDLGWYITEIGGMKVGFGSKYQLKKFLQKLKSEFFSDGQIPGSNIKIAPIPEIEEPLVRRMGAVAVQDNSFSAADKRKMERSPAGPQLWEISDGSEAANKVINNQPTGPII